LSHNLLMQQQQQPAIVFPYERLPATEATTLPIVAEQHQQQHEVMIPDDDASNRRSSVQNSNTHCPHPKVVVVTATAAGAHWGSLPVPSSPPFLEEVRGSGPPLFARATQGTFGGAFAAAVAAAPPHSSHVSPSIVSTFALTATMTQPATQHDDHSLIRPLSHNIGNGRARGDVHTEDSDIALDIAAAPRKTKRRYEKQMEAVVAHERRKERREEAQAASALVNANNNVPYDEELGHLMFDPVAAACSSDDVFVSAGNDDAASLACPSWVDRPAAAHCCGKDALLHLSSLSRRGLDEDRRTRQRNQLREDERRFRLWQTFQAERGVSKDPSARSDTVGVTPRDRREETIAVALDALMFSVYNAGWRPPPRSHNNVAITHQDRMGACRVIASTAVVEAVLPKLPTNVVMIFDTSSLISAYRWVDVLELLLSLGNTIVVPPTVLHELDFTIKRWRAGEHQEWVAQRNLEDGKSAAGGGGAQKRPRGGSDSVRPPRAPSNHHHHLDVDACLAKRAMVLRDWFALHQQAFDDAVVDDAHPHDEEDEDPLKRTTSEQDALQMRYAPGRASIARSTDTIETLWRQDAGGHLDAIPPAHNNDDRILRVAMFFFTTFLMMQRHHLRGSGSSGGRPVMLVTDDRMLAIKARSERIAVATSLQLLQWK
jgi:hypothetical protein